MVQNNYGSVFVELLLIIFVILVCYRNRNNDIYYTMKVSCPRAKDSLKNDVRKLSV